MKSQRVGISSGVFAVLASAASAWAHGTISGSRIEQVYKAGPSGGTPAAWNGSYYTWNQNSNNFPGYGAAGFSYSSVMADGSIASAGINDGVHSPLNFSGLNTPGSGWKTTAATAGQPLSLTWVATAPHDPSFFQIFLTKPGYDVTTQPLTWASLQDLGRWESGTSNAVSVGSGPNTISGGTGTLYNFSVPIPTDRTGRESLVVIWQRRDPAGEAFVSVSDLQIASLPTLSVATWKAAAGTAGAWDAAANWSSGVVPNGDTVDVLIDGGRAGASDVTVADAAVRDLTVDAGDVLRIAHPSRTPSLRVYGNAALGGTVDVGGASGGGSVRFAAGPADHAVSGVGTIRLGGTPTAASAIVNESTSRKVTIGSGVTIDVAGDGRIDGWFDNNAPVAVNAPGRTMTLQGVSAAKPFTQNGNVIVSNNATLRIGDNVVTNGSIDLRGGHAEWTYNGAAQSPAATIRAMLVGGFANGFASGAVFSSTAAANAVGLGYRDDGSSTVTVLRTYYGDADLDGGVSINDFNALAANFGQASGRVWTQGDFDYDGGVSINDFNLLAGNFGRTLPASADAWAGLLAFAAAHDDLAAFAAVTGVPEPTALVLTAAAVTLGLRRRTGVGTKP